MTPAQKSIVQYAKIVAEIDALLCGFGKANVAPVYLGLQVPMKFFASVVAVVAVDGVSDSVGPLYLALKDKRRKKS